MSRLKKSTRLQMVIVCIPILLIALYLWVFLNELRVVYYMSEMNARYVFSDSTSIEIESYTYNEGGISELKSVDGRVLKVADCNMGLFNNPDNVVYYIESENILLQSTGSHFGKDFIMSRNAIPVICMWFVITMLLLGARISGDFEVLSNIRWFIVYMIFGFVGALLFDMTLRLW